MAELDRTARSLERNFQRILRDVFGDAAAAGKGHTHPRCNFAQADWIPPVDVLDEADNYLVICELPGVPKDKAKVELADENTLCIHGEYERPKELYEKAGHLNTGEIIYGKFCRAVPLPAGRFDANKIEAKMEHGLLKIKVGKAPLPKAKQISIQ
ncbi:HSP20-like chaperone [Phlyctochytrium arcticum]|nr:HSP20-like chaperone [Phlyctochytrium arcticum]